MYLGEPLVTVRDFNHMKEWSQPGTSTKRYKAKLHIWVFFPHQCASPAYIEQASL